MQDKPEVVFALVGHSYPVLRSNTHTTLCSVHKPQPMYVEHTSKNSKLSMYSTWRAAAPLDVGAHGLTSKQLLDLYSSSKRRAHQAYNDVIDVTSPTDDECDLDVVHSSYWQAKKVDVDDKGHDDRIGDVISSVKEVVSKYAVRIIMRNFCCVLCSE